MDKLIAELLEILRELAESHQRLLTIANARHEAMRCFDVAMLNTLLERERHEMTTLSGIETRRQNLLARFQAHFGKQTQLSVSQIAARAPEPAKTQLLTLAARLKALVEQLDRTNRINNKVSQGVVNAISRVLKVVTGMAQHAGLYMRNGRKAAVAGIHILDAVA